MAKSPTSASKILGIALMVVGLGLAYWGYQLSGSVGAQLSQAVTGTFTDKVMNFYLSGAVSFVIGMYIFIKN